MICEREGESTECYFVDGDAELPAVGPDVVGAKAHNLIKLRRLGLGVPPAFILGTSHCRRYLSLGDGASAGIAQLVSSNIRRLEAATKRTFGGSRRPLLVSVRSGAPVSMPGMMDTVLDVGLNDTSVRGLIRMTGNPRLAWDCYRRLVQSFATVVRGCSPQPFEHAYRKHASAAESGSTWLDTEALEALAHESLDLVSTLTGAPFPQNPMEQLAASVEAVFRSWNSTRAVEYRRMHRIPDETGTAVTIQMMVFGNSGGTSGSGVGFTRNPSNGANEIYLDFMFDAQGEDVVSGTRTVRDSRRFSRTLPTVQSQLERVKGAVEKEFRDVQDFEFTVEEGRLYLLQTRAAKRTPWAALRIATDLVHEGLIDTETALERLSKYDLKQIERRRLAADPGSPLATGTPASIGVASGGLAFDAERAQALARSGRKVVLMREEASTQDIAGLAVSDALVTARGGRTSHATVVARQLGKVCVVGCAGLRVDAEHRCCSIGDRRLAEEDVVTVDGDAGRIYSGKLDWCVEKPAEALAEVEQWAAMRRSNSG
jgi:pyruvate,orthophosphate dikinase